VLYQLFTLVLDTAQPEDYLKKEYNRLEKDDSFRSMVVEILNYINEQAINFTNVLIVTFDDSFFYKVLKKEFERR